MITQRQLTETLKNIKLNIEVSTETDGRLTTTEKKNYFQDRLKTTAKELKTLINLIEEADENHPNHIFKDTPHLKYNEQELKDIARAERKNDQLKEIKLMIANCIINGTENFSIELREGTEKDEHWNLKEFNELLNDYKDLRDNY